MKNMHAWGWLLACLFIATSAEAVNNVWYRDKGADTVIIFVHGFLSDSSSCWLNERAHTFWPKLIFTDPQFRDVDIFLGGYYTQLDSADYGVRQASDELLAALRRRDPIHGRVLDRKNIVFVCHSLGGVVVRYLLATNFLDFGDKTAGLVLIASPSFGSEQATRLALLSEFYGNQMGRELQWGSDTLKDIDARFKDVVYHKTIKHLVGVEAYENHFVIHNRFLPDEIKVVTAESAGRYFGAPVLLRGTDHFDCVKPSSRSHPAYELLVDFFQQQFWPLMTQLRAAAADAAKVAATTSKKVAPPTESEKPKFPEVASSPLEPVRGVWRAHHHDAELIANITLTFPPPVGSTAYAGKIVVTMRPVSAEDHANMATLGMSPRIEGDVTATLSDGLIMIRIDHSKMVGVGDGANGELGGWGFDGEYKVKWSSDTKFGLVDARGETQLTFERDPR